jgi:hypothetical protein
LAGAKQIGFRRQPANKTHQLPVLVAQVWQKILDERLHVSGFARPKMPLPLAFRQFLNRIAQHRARHVRGVLVKKFFQDHHVALADFAEHPADGLVHQIMLIGAQ